MELGCHGGVPTCCGQGLHSRHSDFTIRATFHREALDLQSIRIGSTTTVAYICLGWVAQAVSKVDCCAMANVASLIHAPRGAYWS